MNIHFISSMEDVKSKQDALVWKRLNTEHGAIVLGCFHRPIFEVCFIHNKFTKWLKKIKLKLKVIDLFYTDNIFISNDKKIWFRLYAFNVKPNNMVLRPLASTPNLNLHYEQLTTFKPE